MVIALLEMIFLEDGLRVFPYGFLDVLSKDGGYVHAHADQLVQIVTEVVIID